MTIKKNTNYIVENGEETEQESSVCMYCLGTGGVSVDERDRDGNWERGVGTRKCECRLNDQENEE